MNYNSPLIAGTLVRRYKRFLADIKLKNGEVITAHCPNSGAMTGCALPGWEVRISKQSNPKRKLGYTWEMIHNGQCWIGINTQVPNVITLEALKSGKIEELHNYREFKREVYYGSSCRFDLLAKDKDGLLCYIEVKSVTLVDADGYYAFPDAVTKRGKKHLLKLINVIENGHRAVMIYVIQRSDGTKFKPAKHVDPEYAECLALAFRKGVKILPYQGRVTPTGIEITEKIDFILDS